MGKQWWIGRIAVINWVSPNVRRMDNRSELVCTYEFCSVFALFCLSDLYCRLRLQFGLQSGSNSSFKTPLYVEYYLFFYFL